MSKFRPKGPMSPAKKMAMSAPSGERQKPVAPAPFTKMAAMKKGGKVKKK